MVEDAGGHLDWVECHLQGQVLGLEKTGLGRFRALSVLGPPCRGLAGEEKRRRDPPSCLETCSCSYTHFTGVGMGGLEGSPAFQGHPKGLCGTAHRPRGEIGEGGRGRKGGRRVMQDAPG